ncbi:hypothetical protein AVEN_110984-1, partial [Araneus ventricosus]
MYVGLVHTKSAGTERVTGSRPDSNKDSP